MAISDRTVEAGASDTPSCSAGVAAADSDSIVTLMRRLAAAVAGDLDEAADGAGGAAAGVKRGAAAWLPTVRQDVLAQLGVAINGLGMVRGSVLVAEKATAEWKAAGAISFEHWLKGQTGDGKQATGREVREAEKAEAVPAVREQVVAGAIGTENTRIIADLATNGTDAQSAAVASREGQEFLLSRARAQDADRFKITVQKWAATLDPQALEEGQTKQRATRFLNVTEAPDGTYIKTHLDTAAGHVLVLALEALSPKPAADDHRDLGERRADAITTMANSVLGSPSTTPGAHVPPQVSFILTEATWLAAPAHATAERERRNASLTTFGLPLEDAPDAPSTRTDADADADADAHADCWDGTPLVRPAPYPPATWED